LRPTELGARLFADNGLDPYLVSVRKWAVFENGPRPVTR
jgi:hypothetical protein